MSLCAVPLCFPWLGSQCLTALQQGCLAAICNQRHYLKRKDLYSAMRKWMAQHSVQLLQ